jgi:hypothetical protein
LWYYRKTGKIIVVTGKNDCRSSVGAVRRLVASERYAWANLMVRRTAGVFIALVGLYLIFNQLQTIR